MRRNRVFLPVACFPLLMAFAASGQTFSVLKSFTGSDGQGPGATLTLSAGTLFGTTYLGGVSNFGTVFKLDIATTNHTVLQHFFGPLHTNGAIPSGGLVLSGSTLYGTTEAGGSAGVGTIFKLSTNGTGFGILRSMAIGDNNSRPRAGLLLVGTNLYGTAYGAPPPPTPFSYGSVFKISTNAATYSVLKDFTFSAPNDGKNPWSGLVGAGTNLFGTTFSGGSSTNGTVFRISTNGFGYTLLKDFALTNGAGPRGDLLLVGTNLYGVTQSGGSAGLGTVFRLSTNGAGFTVLKHFTGSDGANPVASLALLGSSLYGTTYAGGNSSLGTVFKMNSDGSGFAILRHFAGTDGANPVGGVVISGGTLYGTTYTGGDSNNGVIFRINLSPLINVENQAGTPVIGWTAIEGLSYQLQYKKALTQVNW